jgi:hypothetical protein
MVSQESKPPFRWFGISWSASHPTGDRSLGYIESEPGTHYSSEAEPKKGKVSLIYWTSTAT